MLVSVRLKIVVILTQDRCKFCTECTLVSEIILNAPDVSVRLEIVLVSMQDRCTVCAKQVLEIILEAPDGTPR